MTSCVIALRTVVVVDDQEMIVIFPRLGVVSGSQMHETLGKKLAHVRLPATSA